MRHIKLTRQERKIKNALLRGEYTEASKAEVKKISQAIARYRKNPKRKSSFTKEEWEKIKRLTSETPAVVLKNSAESLRYLKHRLSYDKSLRETLDVLNDPSMMRQIRQSLRYFAKHGKGIPWETAKKKLGL